MSASSSTIAADLPPSSRLTRLSCSPHSVAMWRPAALEPVNAILSTPGWRTSASPTSRTAGKHGHDTVGKVRARSIISANHSASNGVSGAGLTTTVQPAISAGISFGMIRFCGTFHGTMMPTTPTGARRRCTSPSTPWRRSAHGKSRATARVRCIIETAAAAWPSRLKLRGEPISSVIRSAISSRCASRGRRVLRPCASARAASSRGHGPSSKAAAPRRPPRRRPRESPRARRRSGSRSAAR